MLPATRTPHLATHPVPHFRLAIAPARPSTNNLILR
jgi:hypothetical protein